ncbi:protein kinase superfamily protein [Actinidia rufa]|uniref:Protein kinase superfamily protein n=1 Tax=Actinidia rufa TaxID=165716 RepID=A0A7J0GUH3_9ERIC|nr:protein kinase superfamily protein [Actinidia rufa]
MDVKNKKFGEIPETEKKSGNGEWGLGLNSKLKGMGSLSDKNMLGKSTGSFSSKDMFFRADKIDLKSLDVQWEKHLSRVWSKNIEVQKPKEEWEIDPSKLDIRYLIARGTYGTVYRGTYDSRDVAEGPLCTRYDFRLSSLDLLEIPHTRYESHTDPSTAKRVTRSDVELCPPGMIAANGLLSKGRILSRVR